MASSPLYRKSPAEMPGLLHIERPGESTGPQLVEKARLRRSFPTERVSPALSARPGKRAGKPCCARLPNPPHMSLDSEYSSEGCGPPNLPEGFFDSLRPGESTGPIWDTAVMKDRRTVNPTRGEPLRPPCTPAEGGPGGHPRATMNACPRGAPMPSTSFRRKGVQGVTPWRGPLRWL